MTITTGKFISQLDTSIKKLESLVQSLQCSSFHPSKKQYQALDDLSLRLTTTANNLPTNVATLKTQRAEPSFEEGMKLIAQAQSETKDVMATGKLKNRLLFARNVTYFFDGQRDSIVDSEATKARKHLTSERCVRISTLSPDGLISWAVAFMPTTWMANLMSKDTFDYVFEHIESDESCVWPPDIYHILSGLAVEEPLRGLEKYHRFLEALDEDKEKARSTNQARKRRRGPNAAASTGELLLSMQTNELIPESSNGLNTPNKAPHRHNSSIDTGNKEGSNQASEKMALRPDSGGHGDVFALTIEDTKHALSSPQNIQSVFLTNPHLRSEPSFLTAWVSPEMGKCLGKRGQILDYKYRLTKGTEELRRQI